MRNSLEDTEKLADKLSEEDKSTISNAVENTLTWLMENPEASKEDYQDKLNEIEDVCNPIISNLYDSTGSDYAHDDL